MHARRPSLSPLCSRHLRLTCRHCRPLHPLPVTNDTTNPPLCCLLLCPHSAWCATTPRPPPRPASSPRGHRRARLEKISSDEKINNIPCHVPPLRVEASAYRSKMSPPTDLAQRQGATGGGDAGGGEAGERAVGLHTRGAPPGVVGLPHRLTVRDPTPEPLLRQLVDTSSVQIATPTRRPPAAWQRWSSPMAHPSEREKACGPLPPIPGVHQRRCVPNR